MFDCNLFLKGLKLFTWRPFNNVTKSLQEPIARILEDRISANRQAIKNTVPPDQDGSSTKVITRRPYTTTASVTYG